jgi:hypothetical protein
MTRKPTRSAPPRLLPSGKPDQSNVTTTPEFEAFMKTVAAGLPAFAAGKR